MTYKRGLRQTCLSFYKLTDQFRQPVMEAFKIGTTVCGKGWGKGPEKREKTEENKGNCFRMTRGTEGV